MDIRFLHFLPNYAAMVIEEIIAVLADFAPPAYQESYDNAQLITGNPKDACTGVLIALDVTTSVVQEAVAKNCNLIVAHHPILFKGIKKLTGGNYVEDTLLEAIKNNIALFALHTNLDKVHNGVNKKIADIIGLKKQNILLPEKGGLKKLFTYVPLSHLVQLSNALFDAGAGHIGNYDKCSYFSEGKGTFRGLEGSDPYIGEAGELSIEEEYKLEVIYPSHIEPAVIAALHRAHPYEEVAYDIVELANSNRQVGIGIIGELESEMSEVAFLGLLQQRFGTPVIKHTKLLGRNVKKIAVCGGSGSFLTAKAVRAQADVFVTSDVKYHEFFDAEDRLLLADIGHYESEQFTIDLIFEILESKFPNFAVLKTTVNTNPVSYYSGDGPSF